MCQKEYSEKIVLPLPREPKVINLGPSLVFMERPYYIPMADNRRKCADCRNPILISLSNGVIYCPICHNYVSEVV